MASRLEVRAQIIGCTRCGLAGGCRRPVPFDGPDRCDVAVVGEAPGRVEDEEGKPFVGPSGQLARSLVEPRLGAVAWLNVVSCWPRGTPTGAEVEACRPNLDVQLELIRPRFLLVFGGVAVGALAGDYKISEVRGRWWRARASRAWAMATWHPAAVLRNPALKVDVLDDLSVFRQGVEGTLPPYVWQTCVKCGSACELHVDEVGIAWCGKHWGQRLGTLGRGKDEGHGDDGGDGQGRLGL